MCLALPLSSLGGSLSLLLVLVLERHGAVFTVPLMGLNFTFLVGPEAQAPFFKLNVR